MPRPISRPVAVAVASGLVLAAVLWACAAGATAKTVATARLVGSANAPVSFAAVAPAKKKARTISFGASAPSRSGTARVGLTGSLRIRSGKRSVSFTRLGIQPATGGATLVAQSAGKRLSLLTLRARKGKPVRIDARAGTVRIDGATATLTRAAATRVRTALHRRSAPSTTRSVGSVTLVVAADETPTTKTGPTGGTSPQQAASSTPPPTAPGVASAALTWQLAHEAGPSTGTLSNYAAGPIGQIGGAGSVVASGGASGGPITNVGGVASPAAGAAGSGVKVPFAFSATGAAVSVDPTTRTGTIGFAGTLTFNAHGALFWTVVDPTLAFDGPASVRLVANGVVPTGGIGSTAAPTPYGMGPARQTVFTFDGAAATWTDNGGGSWTVGNLVPAATTAISDGTVSFLSGDTVFDPIRTWFTTDRANQLFSVTFKLA